MRTVGCLVLILSLGSSVAIAEDRGFIDNIGQTLGIVGIVPTSTGARVATTSDVFDVGRDGQVRPLLSWPFQIKRMAPAHGGQLFLGLSSLQQGRGPYFNLVFKTDSDGKVLWARRVYETRDDEDHQLQLDTIDEASDGSIIVAGTHGHGITVAKFSSDGRVVWQKRADYSGRDAVTSAVVSRDGGVLVIGAVEQYATLVRFGADGALVDHHVFVRGNGTVLLNSGVELPDGGFIVVGTETLYGTVDTNAVIMRVDANGSIVWEKTMGGDGGDNFNTIVAHGPKRFDILGSTTSFGGVFRNWLVTIDDKGTVLRQIAVSGGHTSAATSALVADGNSVWAGLLEIPTHLARITAETNCDMFADTVAIEATTRVVVATERAMESGDDDAVIDAYVVPANTQSTLHAQRECTKAAAPRTRLPATAGVRESEEMRFLASTSQMLADRKFKALDSLAASLRTSHEKTDAGESKLEWFYAAFHAEARPLVALGAKGVERLIEEWVATTNSTASRTALAEFEIDLAWRVRGSGFTSTVIEPAAREFGWRREKANEILDRLDQADECDVKCLAAIIKVRSLGGWSAPLRKIVRLDPGYFNAFRDAANYLRPQWGGSPEEIAAFAREAADATRLIYGDLMYAVIIQVMPYKDRSDIHNNYDWPRLRSGLQTYQRLFPKSTSNLHDLAFWARRERDQAAAREAFENPLLQWDDQQHRWFTRKDFEDARKWALASAAPAPATQSAPATPGVAVSATRSAPATPAAPVSATQSAPATPAVSVSATPAAVARHRIPDWNAFPPAPGLLPFETGQPPDKSLTVVDVSVAGKSSTSVAFLIQIGPTLLPVTVIDANDVQNGNVTISHAGSYLDVMAVPRERRPQSVIVLPVSALPVKASYLYSEPPAERDVLRVRACKVQKGCIESDFEGTVVTVTKAAAKLEFTMTIPPAPGVVLVGAPVVGKVHDFVTGIVRSVRKSGNEWVLDCESLEYALLAARNTVQLGRK